ncbi:thioredoxin family protein [Ralstonia insidiosa]|jgi:thioredoxin 1|uniref:thioredoxin family protein n=1 Tax=Ralstonia TaxID=48736 RepID=UPI000664AC1E|nr:thioredoxin family protein [Ralstonia insidiosa]KMW48728.1 hypothetical protein AC240_02285 [Ralstonia sp. MD27]MBX3773560.1 thioredoxin family protein [Ralstonia pickettii]NOZ15753.1 thioredoxin family protein [Betaproteobacteria bacterium]MBA9857400.1 thioredoxin [Ralstonia insidiosa]MBA9870730.1 thioredoxin [Ralstonia insidiosa]
METIDDDAVFQTQVIKAPKGQPVLVSFMATWCGPWRAIKPKLDELEASYKNRVTFVAVDVDGAEQTAASVDINSLPTFMMFIDGKEQKGTFSGANSDKLVSELLKPYALG